METKVRRKFTDEYKIDVIRMHEEKSIPIRILSKDLDIGMDVLYGWRRKFGKIKPSKTGSDINSLEVKKLTKRLREVEEERDILKKAMAIFTQVPKKDFGL